MIKTIISTAIMATIFTGCVGTVVAKNEVKDKSSERIQQAKPMENNRVKNENNTTSIQK